MRVITMLAAAAVLVASTAHAQDATDYRVLATNKTSTMQKEMQDAGSAGYRYAAVMGGETSVGGKEVVVLMQKAGAGVGAGKKYEYRLLATSKTSTMEKELQQAADAGFEYVGQTVFESLFGGKEVTCILERDSAGTQPVRYEYKLLATKRTSTLQKELQAVGADGFTALGMTVGETALGGTELVVITRRPAK